MRQEKHVYGFTLIELSIVLVIIGLIIGGILVGQDLIKGAEVRAQLSQIEKYNSVVNTFRGKFAAIPGDVALGAASQLGLVTTNCNGTQGERDGNGLLDGYPGIPLLQSEGETALFWQDLSSDVAGHLIDGQFPNSGAGSERCNGVNYATNTTPGTTFVGDYLPTGKIGHGTYVYVYDYSGYNWYSLAAVSSTASNGNLVAAATLPVMQSYNIDKKADDGLPVSGTIQAVYLTNEAVTPSASAPSDSTTTCYNTGNNTYSISSYASYGANGNCALSFRFQ